ncbi:transposase [Roseovarius sp. SK2]|uniref:transposase n=1 Tax=Roseovarius sp. SK2 TaxID=3028381 RepID=UPI003FD488C7
MADLAEELDTLPEAARPPLRALFDQLAETQARIDRLTDEIGEVHRQNEVSRRLASIAGVGVLTATAIAATTPDVSNFGSARNYVGWLGLTPKQHSPPSSSVQLRFRRVGTVSIQLGWFPMASQYSQVWWSRGSAAGARHFRLVAYLDARSASRGLRLARYLFFQPSNFVGW